jgi:RNA polymerase sigma-70 factor (ECF subfamily)
MAVSGSEEALFAGLHDRELPAYERLYDDYGRRALGLAYRLTGDYSLAQDVVQDAFLAIWQQADRLDPARGRLQPLLFAVVHHKASDHLRRRQRQDNVTSLFPRAQLMAQPPEDPEQAAIQASERGSIMRALALLSPEQRQTVQLAYYGGHSHSEIARLTQAPLGTVKSRLRVAMQRLRLIMWPGNE